MDTLYQIFATGLISVVSFLFGAYIYHKGHTDTAPMPPLNLNKQEETPQANWDEL